MEEAIKYLLEVRIGELSRKHAKQFKARDMRKLDQIEKEIKKVENMKNFIKEIV